ncbi:MAG: methyltransferase domain-containing protein [Geobacteraceae bacterium]|nr:methyltransferase domain-containing protein [Geobacteraceae bacterium]
MNGQAQEIRNEVSRDYAQRIAAPNGCGCGALKPQSGPLATLAGYSAEQLATVPDSIAGSSFACGNPLAYAGVREGDVVLDLGSGAGLDLLLAARMVGPTGRVIGVDMTDAMIARANENIRAAKAGNVEVRKGLIEELPVEDGSVDWVISNCVINLSPEKEKVFAEIARVLKPGGTMLVSDIMAQDLPAELLTIPALYTSCIAGAISEEAYLSGMAQAGLVEGRVLDRLIYDAQQIEGYAEAALGEAFAATAEISGRIESYARELTGKIWSAKVYGRKPL